MCQIQTRNVDTIMFKYRRYGRPTLATAYRIEGHDSLASPTRKKGKSLPFNAKLVNGTYRINPDEHKRM